MGVWARISPAGREVCRRRSPTHAYLRDSGDSWDCERSLTVAERCEKVAIPANGYLNSRGNGWECERGYRENRRPMRA